MARGSRILAVEQTLILIGGSQILLYTTPDTNGLPYQGDLPCQEICMYVCMYVYSGQSQRSMIQKAIQQNF